MSKKKVVAFKGGKFYNFDSISDCANELGVDKHSVINLVNHKKTSAGVTRKSVGGYQIVSEEEKGLIDTSYIPEVHSKQVGGRIKGTDGTRTLEFDSQAQAQRELGISRQSIQKAIQSGKATKGWNFEFIK